MSTNMPETKEDVTLDNIVEVARIAREKQKEDGEKRRREGHAMNVETKASIFTSSVARWLRIKDVAPEFIAPPEGVSPIDFHVTPHKMIGGLDIYLDNSDYPIAVKKCPDCDGNRRSRYIHSLADFAETLDGKRWDSHDHYYDEDSTHPKAPKASAEPEATEADVAPAQAADGNPDLDRLKFMTNLLAAPATTPILPETLHIGTRVACAALLRADDVPDTTRLQALSVALHLETIGHNEDVLHEQMENAREYAELMRANIGDNKRLADAVEKVVGIFREIADDNKTAIGMLQKKVLEGK